MSPTPPRCLRARADRARHLETSHNGHGLAELLLEPGVQSAAVVAIAPLQLDAGKDLLHGFKEGPGSLLIGVVGTGDLDSKGRDHSKTVANRLLDINDIHLPFE